MGYLLKGVWRSDDGDRSDKRGEFVRKGAQFRDRVTADGSSGYAAAAGRYHLYVSFACPWAHRTLIIRKLKRLEEVISISAVHPLMLENGWAFSDEAGLIPDLVNGAAFLCDVYVKAKPDYTGRVTVPVLWDKQTGTIVNNESAEIIRMLNTEFNAFTDVREDYYPEPLRAKIDAVNAFVYENINNGV